MPLNTGYESTLSTQDITEVMQNVTKHVALILMKLKFYYIDFQKQQFLFYSYSNFGISFKHNKGSVYLAKKDKSRLHVHTRFSGSWLPLYAKVLSKTLC